MPQLRQNPITGEWVVIAPERSKRPGEFVAVTPTVEVQHDRCDFCLPGPVYREQLPAYETDQIYVVKNKFPSFVENLDTISPRSYPVGHNFFRAKPALGAHDVVVVKDGQLSLPHFSQSLWGDLLTCFQRRSLETARLPDVVVTLPIYNHGLGSGASVLHPHAQIFSPSLVPPLIQRELHGSFDHFHRLRQCLFCDIVKHEREFKSRIVAENSTFVAFTFYSARFPFELWILPKYHADRFERAEAQLIDGLAALLPTVFERLNARLHNPPLNLWIHSLPTMLDPAPYFHWHLEIAPRLATYGGFELGGGMVVDMVSPEQAAAFLRASN